MEKAYASSDEDDLGGIDEELLELQAVLGLDYQLASPTQQQVRLAGQQRSRTIEPRVPRPP